MKTIIIYESKHGSTEKRVQNLAKLITGEVTLCNLKKEKTVKIDSYDQVIIGGPMYIGSLPKGINKFCHKEEAALLTKSLGLFACGMAEGERAQEELTDAYPTVLCEHAKALGFFGGAFYLNKMSFMERWIINKASKAQGGGGFEDGPQGKFIERFYEEQMNTFASAMNL